MAAIQSPVKRFVKRLLLAISVLLAANILLLGAYAYYYKESVSGEMLPIPLLKLLSHSLKSGQEHFILDSIATEQLDSQHLWAMLLDDRQGTVLWSHNIPPELPGAYTLSDIALLSRYYLKDYPVYTWKHSQGLIVLGFPKGSMTKVTGVLSLSEVNILSWRIIVLIVCDLLILFLIYLAIDRRTVRSVADIMDGIRSLAAGKLIHLEEKGTLSEIAVQLNRTSDLLEARSAAQENWIAGVSHDVRTPLSVILGYSEQIEQYSALPEEVREKASNIKLQGVRLRNLVNDLNLAIRLGSGDMILQKEHFHPAVFCRHFLADFLNDVSNEKYPVEITIDKGTEAVFISGTPDLLQRAFYNLLYNSVRHNPDGCVIHFQLQRSGNHVVFTLSDNGKGLTAGQLEELRNRPDYLSSAKSVLLQQHGLGLYVVQQIVRLHNAVVSFDNGITGGFQTAVIIPLIQEN